MLNLTQPVSIMIKFLDGYNYLQIKLLTN